MKALAIDRMAMETIVQVRQLQTGDFEAGDQLGRILVGEGSDGALSAGLAFVTDGDIGRIRGAQVDRFRQLVINVEAAPIFAGRTSAQALSVLQKLLRFALKIWNQQAFSPAEHTIGGEPYIKYVLFPLNYASSSRYRVTLQRVPRAGDPPSDHIYAFRHGHDDAGGPNENPALGLLNQSIHAHCEDLAEVAAASGSHGASSPLVATRLSDADRSGSGIQVPFEQWVPLLTDRQRGFATKPLVACERLEGPAGTGKTLALLLKVVATVRAARLRGVPYHALFLTHSIATRAAIESRLDVIDPVDQFHRQNPLASEHSVTVTTLQEWCANLLGPSVAEVEYLDRDAAESKNTQLLYIDEALDEAIRAHLPTYERLMSPAYVRFLREEDRWGVAEMMQHEIAVVIKGRAEDDLDRYKQLPRLAYGLPVESAGDKSWTFVVFRSYQRRLSETNQFDTDDIVLTALRQLDTPVWRRRRQREGFDGVFVDEAHLFNLNELSLVHFLTRVPEAPSIAFAVDRSQAVGDRGVTTLELEGQLLRGAEGEVTRMSVVFRSSPEIISLAQTVTAAGASLFTNFDDALVEAEGLSGETDGALREVPSYRLVPTDEALVSAALEEAAGLAQGMPNGRSGVAVVCFDNQLFGRIKQEVLQRKKPFEVLSRRGDLAAVVRASDTNRHILALAEYVGGLEFDAVVLVGVDEGRVPPLGGRGAPESRHFARYASHNLLYVAITRARYAVRILASAERGLSEVLHPARVSGLLVEQS